MERLKKEATEDRLKKEKEEQERKWLEFENTLRIQKEKKDRKAEEARKKLEQDKAEEELKKTRREGEEEKKKKEEDEEIIDDLEEKDMSGKGGSKKQEEKGLYDSQINEFMRPFDKFGYLGTFSSDELPKVVQEIIERKNGKESYKNRISFILNLDNSKSEGTHWVAIFIDPSFDQSLEYFDSFGEPPTENFMKNIKKIITAINPETYLKFKVNKVKQQRVTSDLCRYYAMYFIIQRYKGVPFDHITGFDKMLHSLVNKSEKKIKEFKNKINEFELI